MTAGAIAEDAGRRERSIVTLVVVMSISAAFGGLVYLNVEPACRNYSGSMGSGFVAAPQTVWDEQATLSFSTRSTLLETNVTISSPHDSDGYGPAFLLNAVTNVGYWYQVGVAYNWGIVAPMSGYDPGFVLITAVFSPTDAAEPEFELTDPANLVSGDLVGLEMAFDSDCVVMSWTVDNQILASQSYSSFGATLFVNNSSIPSSTFGPSLMTEWWHAQPYYGQTASAVYTMPSVLGSFVGMGIQERIPATNFILFSNALQAHLGCGCETTFGFENVTETVSPSDFTTGV